MTNLKTLVLGPYSREQIIHTLKNSQLQQLNITDYHVTPQNQANLPNTLQELTWECEKYDTFATLSSLVQQCPGLMDLTLRNVEQLLLLILVHCKN